MRFIFSLRVLICSSKLLAYRSIITSVNEIQPCSIKKLSGWQYFTTWWIYLRITQSCLLAECLLVFALSQKCRAPTKITQSSNFYTNESQYLQPHLPTLIFLVKASLLLTQTNPFPKNLPIPIAKHSSYILQDICHVLKNVQNCQWC